MIDRHAIIHIGTWKTGSTSLQIQLSSNRKSLVNQGAWLPSAPGHGTCQLLLYYALGGGYKPEQPCWEGLAPEVRLQRFVREFDDEMKQLPDTVDRVLFVEECFSSHMQSQDEMRRLHDFLKPYFSRISIVIYLRRQDQFLASLYTQMLRGGYVGPPLGKFPMKRVQQQGDYHRLVSDWAAAFGADAICLRLYENRGKPFDSIADFFALSGLALPSNRETIRRNTSINLVGQALLQALGPALFNQEADISVASGQWNRLIRLVEKKHPGRGWLPTRSEGADIVALFAEGNEALRQRYFPERPSLFSEDFSALPEAAEQPGDDVLLNGAYSVLLEALAERIEPAAIPHANIQQHKRRQDALAARKAKQAARQAALAARRAELAAMRAASKPPAARVLVPAEDGLVQEERGG